MGSSQNKLQENELYCSRPWVQKLDLKAFTTYPLAENYI